MRVRLTGIRNMRSYKDSERFEYNGIVNGFKDLDRFDPTFEVYYRGTKIIEHYPSGSTYIPAQPDWATMNTAAVLHHFLPEGYRANYKFNYRNYPRVRENERIMVTGPDGFERDITNGPGFWL